MKHLSRNLILSLGVITPTISSPALLMTSCSTIWGYNTPIQMGSAISGAAHDPFKNFRSGSYLDNNGNNIASYLQNNYTIDVRTSSNYAYSNPVTKWTYTTDETPAGATTQVMDLEDWQHNNLGWKTSSSTDFSNNSTFSGKLTKDKYVTHVNNENIIQAANIDFTTSIASTISSYIAGAIKYQASQINASNDTDLNIAWGNGAKFDGAEKRTLAKGQKEAVESETEEAIKNRLFYEYVFAQTNSHVTHKNHGAFLRSTSVNFNYDDGYFPIPSYQFKDGVRVDISEATKKLLMGSGATADTKFCDAGIDGATTLPAYFTSKTDGTQEITIGDKFGETKATPVNVKLSYTDYTFTNVPLVVTATDLTQRWINPTKKDSIQIKDYYINDQETIDNQVGKLENIQKYSGHDGKVHNKEYVFDTAKSGNTHVQAAIVGTKVDNVDHVDTRIVAKAGDKLDGNKFIVLVTYTVREFNNTKFLIKEGQPTEYVQKLVDSWKSVEPTAGWNADKVNTWLTQRNMVSLSSASNIFPIHILNIYPDLFKKAYTAKDDTIKEVGYIINADKVATHADALLGIYNRTTTEGYKASASSLTDDSKNLLTFLTYMFGTDGATTIDFKDDVVTAIEF